jgi:hypothetical protein
VAGSAFGLAGEDAGILNPEAMTSDEINAIRHGHSSRIGVRSLPSRSAGFWPRRFVYAASSWVAMAMLASAAMAQSPTAPKRAVDQLIPWLLDEDRQLRGVPFSEVIFDTTGKKVLRFDTSNPVDQRVAKAISTACDETIKRLNAPGGAIQNVERINEVSSHVEDNLRELLNAVPGLRCDFPLTAEGKMGYPDLRIVDLESKRVFYVDPKLYAAGSRDSSFRAFYFEPKKATNKVRDDAVHFIVGFEHQPSPRYGLAGEPREGGSRSSKTMWKLTRWNLVDLAQFLVKLKAEFQGSNRDMYRPEAVVASGSGD